MTSLFAALDVTAGFVATGAAHKTAAVKAWLARRPHWHVHFTPTPAVRINQVERWFVELTRKQLQRGVDIFAAVKRFCLRVEKNCATNFRFR